MKIIDISWPLSERVVEYKNKKTFALNKVKTIEKDGVLESVLTLGVHTGTHVDAPAHFLAHGGTTESIELDQLTGPCMVVDLSAVEGAIGPEHLEEYEFQEGDIVLFKTRNSNLPTEGEFESNFVYLSHAAAEYLIEHEVACVGIDYLGIERNQPRHETHITLMEAGVAIVEGLRLKEVAEGEYLFVCLPLKLHGADAAPARAILYEGVF